MALSPEIFAGVPPAWRAQIESFLQQGAITEDMVPAMLQRANETGFLQASNLGQQGGLAPQMNQAPAARTGGGGAVPADVPDADVFAWLNANQGADARQIVTKMQEVGVQPEQVARVLGRDIGEIRGIYRQTRGEMAAGTPTTNLAQTVAPQTANPQYGNLSDAQVYEYLSANPNASAMEIYQRMQGAGVLPEQVARVLGKPLADVQALYNQTQQEAASRIPTGLLGAEEALRTGQGQATSALNQGQTQGRTDLVNTSQTASNQLLGSIDRGRTDLTAGVNTGLAGLTAGISGANTALQAGAQTGLNALNQGTNQAQSNILGGTNAGVNTIGNALNQGRTDLLQAQNFAQNQFGYGLQDIQGARDTATGQIQQNFGRAEGYLSPFAQSGQNAIPLLEALSGARGSDAFNAAYQESPYIKFLQEQGQRAVTANAAATGGLSGGNVLKELTRFGQGLAGQGLQQQIQNLQGLTSQGMQAAGQAGQFAAGQGSSLAGLTTNAGQASAGQRNLMGEAAINAGQNLSSLGAAGAQNQAQMQYGAGQSLGALSGRQGELGLQTYGNLGAGIADLNVLGGASALQAQSGLGQGLAAMATAGGAGASAITQNLGQNLAGQGQNYANTLANIAQNSGTNIAQNRFDAGRDIANAIGGASTALSNLINQQGAGQADIVGNAGTNINALIQAATNGDTAAKSQLAALLANISTQSSSTYANQPIVPGYQSNYLGQLGQVAGGIGGLMSGYGAMTNPAGVR